MAEQERWHQEVEALKADMASLKRDIADLTKTMKGVAQERAEGAKDAMGEELRQARERLRESYARAHDFGRHKVDDLESTVSQKPLASLATAFGVGFILAKLMDVGGKR